MAGLNKKILCFVDECGTAGDPGFALGCVMAWARDCGRADKLLSDLLEPTAKEIHASQLNSRYVQGLLARYSQVDTPEGMVMMNRLGTVTTGSRPEIYARNVIETVKTAVGQFRKANELRGVVGNVDLILDVNNHNGDPVFDTILGEARKNDGRFKAINRIDRIDSAASRLLQLSDMVAYSRTWMTGGEENAAGLHRTYGIRVL